MSDGILDMIPTNIIIELPLPKPFSVILSPIHITSILPATKVIITVETKNKLLDCKARLTIPNVIPIACINPNTRAVYLVYAFIFFLPSSPDFCSSFKLSKPIVRSCIIIEAVINGPIPNANIVKLLAPDRHHQRETRWLCQPRGRRHRHYVLYEPGRQIPG